MPPVNLRIMVMSFPVLPAIEVRDENPKLGCVLPCVLVQVLGLPHLLSDGLFVLQWSLEALARKGTHGAGHIIKVVPATTNLQSKALTLTDFCTLWARFLACINCVNGIQLIYST